LLFFTVCAINIARAQITTMLTLTTPSSTAAYGQAITFTATLSPSAASGISTDGETVTFNVVTSSDPAGTPYPEILSSGVATLTLAPTAVVPGPVTVTASYPGDYYYFAPSSSKSVTVTVLPVPTTITIGATPVGSAGYSAGTAVILYAYVKSAGSAVSPGQVNFCDATATHCTDIHLLGTAQLNSDGYAAITFVPSIGTHTYKAEFLGTTTYASNTSGTISFDVPGTVPTTTVVTATGSPDSYTLSATVTGHGTASPTGSVEFIDTTNANQVLASVPLGGGTASLGFVNSSSPAVGTNPGAVAMADLNGDGIPDLAVANINGNNVNVLLGNGDGTFTALSGAPSTGSEPNSIVAADFNGDGILDLAVANSGSNTVTLLLGNGDGTFTLKSSPGTGSGPTSVTAADFNGDGIMDLAVANINDADVTVLLGNGDGTFTAATGTPPATGVKPFWIASGDWNGDGKADLVVTNSGATAGSNGLTVLLGNGDGTFSASASPSTGNHPIFVAVGDFNGDGNADLAVTNYTDKSITILLGDGTGKFPTSATYGVGTYPRSVAVGDFNGDGIADLAVVNQGDDTVTVLMGKGDGTFTVAGTSATGGDPYFVAIGDLNGDGFSDLALANYGSNSVTVLLSQLTQTATATATKIVAVGTGTHQVEASYPGDNYYNPSSGNTSVIAVSPPVCTLSVLATSTPLTALAQTNCTDPQNQPLIITINWGDGTSSTAGTTNTHTYSTGGTYTVVLSATDSLGLTGSVQGVFSPNQAPACTLGVAYGGVPSNPNSVPISIPGNCTDPQNQPLTTAITWGDGTSPQVASNPQTYSHAYPQPPAGASPVTYPVTLSATDTSGMSGISNVQQIQVNPQQPAVQSGGSTMVSATIPAPPSTVVGIQVTFICSSVSAIIGGQTVNNALPSQFGISCSSPTVTLSSSPTPVNITIKTTPATLVASNRSGTLSVVYSAIVFPLSGFTLLWLGRSRSRSRNPSSSLWIAIGLIALLCFGLTACGGHFTLPAATPTPTGQYYLTVTETVVHPPAPTGFIQTSLIVPLPVAGSTP
jgi:hypothetical protein